ncbi:MAG TPA: ribonuclease Y [Candidatus Hydrothermia bacterium]|nr:ribonuclease Y [Candidatus Hydrothermae bacterium]MDD3648835.1 ribonuclease Y [Candidatus Hydrothermia bacterium]MDD5572347.1 ribonuclease Y [Candidatus Hydrothermia bacterium]HOK23339.1 ribonuclease Y [Candidatus Hydrothermia bacterium]HOL24149.1 ribonuclease Y [Candidatus Hydrothermia bacterium]
MTTLIFILLGTVVGFGIGVVYFRTSYKKKLEKALGAVEEILSKARLEADEIIHEGEAQAKEYWMKERKKFEKEAFEARKELEKTSKRLIEKEQMLDKKAEQIGRKEISLKQIESELKEREKALLAKEERLDKLNEEAARKLEEIARLTRDEAKQELLKSLEQQVRYESAQLMYRIREEAKEKAEKEAKELVLQAVQRIATVISQENTTSIVPIPSDDLKGRIIGKEGRNIKTFESITGVEVIIDDTPEVVILSSFDPVRREKAKLTLEKLIQDGRIHPAMIEEIYARTEEEFDEHLRKIGEDIALELGLSGFHPDMLRQIGKMKFRTSYGQNLLQHSVEVAYIAGIMASELGLSVVNARRAGLIHDIGKTADETYEGPHAIVGAQIARKLGESDLIVNAIAAHHGEDSPKSPIAVLVQAADAISGARPGARRESIEAYLKRVEKLEQIALGFSGVERAYALQAGREIRIIVEAQKISDTEAFDIARQVAQKIEGEVEFPGQIKVVVIRETRAVEFAR